jgi:type I site-specific restriction-modification system R (restriction) subunit
VFTILFFTTAHLSTFFPATTDLFKIANNKEYTYSFVLKHLAKNESLKDHRFAIIADEAHSSQTGSAASKVKQTLGYHVDEDDDITAEDLLAAEMKEQGKNKNLSYFAPFHQYLHVHPKL